MGKKYLDTRTYTLEASVMDVWDNLDEEEQFLQDVLEEGMKKLDPVGQADGDIDNDGDEDSSDDYLKNRRRAIGRAMKGKKNLKASYGMMKANYGMSEAKQKPYVSSDRDGFHVMNGSGKIVKSFKDKRLAQAYWKKNYDDLMKEGMDEAKAEPYTGGEPNRRANEILRGGPKEIKNPARAIKNPARAIKNPARRMKNQSAPAKAEPYTGGEPNRRANEILRGGSKKSSGDSSIPYASTQDPNQILRNGPSGKKPSKGNKELNISPGGKKKSPSADEILRTPEPGSVLANRKPYKVGDSLLPAERARRKKAGEYPFENQASDKKTMVPDSTGKMVRADKAVKKAKPVRKVRRNQELDIGADDNIGENFATKIERYEYQLGLTERKKVAATAYNTRDYDKTIAIQKALIAKGFKIKADGLLGPNTKAAMKAAAQQKDIVGPGAGSPSKKPEPDGGAAADDLGGPKDDNKELDIPPGGKKPPKDNKELDIPPGGKRKPMRPKQPEVYTNPVVKKNLKANYGMMKANYGMKEEFDDSAHEFQKHQEFKVQSMRDALEEVWGK